MKTFHRFSILIGGILLVALVWKIGPLSIWRKLYRVGWGLAIMVALEGAAEVFYTKGWRCCLSLALQRIPFSKLFGIKLAGYAINNLTPTVGVGGEITKGALLGGREKGVEAASGVLVGKLSFVWAQLLFVAAGSAVVFTHVKLPGRFLAAFVSGAFLLALGLIGLFVVLRKGWLAPLARRLLFRRAGPRWERMRASLECLDRELRSFFREQPFGWYRAMGWYMGGFLCYIFQLWVFLRWSGAGGSLAVASGCWFLSGWFDLVGFAVPLRMGVQEGGRVAALAAFGYDPALGMALAAATRFQEICWGGAGLGIYGLLWWSSEHSPRSLSGFRSPPSRPG